MDTHRFRRIIWRYYRNHGRDFPWRRTHDPYKILVSEVMLQQTQTSRVERKYQEFIKVLLNFRSLSLVALPSLLKLWSGLGYNRRALNLKKTAQIVMEKYSGKLPRDPDLLEKLPGVGPYTAGAVAAMAFNVPAVAVDTNVRRVFLHHFFPRRRKVSDADILKLVAATVDKKNPRKWYYALMDYGAMLAKTVPENPNRQSKHYAIQPKFKGSNRELRGKILRMAVAGKRITVPFLQKQFGEPRKRVTAVLEELRREGFFEFRGRLTK